MKFVKIESNGVVALFLIRDEKTLEIFLSTPTYLEDLAKEIRAFKEYFWVDDEVDWTNTIIDREEHINEFFSTAMMLVLEEDEK